MRLFWKNHIFIKIINYDCEYSENPFLTFETENYENENNIESEQFHQTILKESAEDFISNYTNRVNAFVDEFEEDEILDASRLMEIIFQITEFIKQKEWK